MDNLTEEDMKKYDAYITVMEVNPSENCKSLLFNGSDDISVTNHQNKYFPSSLRNEPQMGVVKHKIKKLEPQNTVSDDSEIKIYGQRGQIKTIIISAATKNTNLLTRRTENDSLNVETFSFPKNYSSSSPLVKSNQIKILSTATVTMPKTKTTYSQLKLSNNTEIGQNNSYNMLRVGDFNNASKIKKYIPHTITSRDLMENDSNTFVQNEEFKKVTNCPKKLNTSSCQLSSNSESIEKSESSLLSYRQGQWASKNGEIATNTYATNAKLQLLYLGSNTKSKTKLNSDKMVKIGVNDSNGPEDDKIKVGYNETRTSQNLNIKRATEEHLYKNKVPLSEEIINLNNQSKSYNECDMSKQFLSCKYEYCDILVYKPELIDNLYCSLECKRLDAKQTVTEKELFINKSTVDLKHHSKKSQKRISKRKQLLTTYCSEDMVKENNDWDEQLKLIFNKLSTKQTQSLLKPSLPIISPESIDDDDKFVDLKPLIEDKDVLAYMTQMQLSSAPKKLFDRPFPTEQNRFVVGQKLEGIDPTNVALFCVMTVSEVCGYRIKLHFDGYQDDYDFWVNADSPDLFYPGWCELNSRVLQPPKNYGNKFNWIGYLEECQAVPAPKHNFVCIKNIDSSKNQHKFHIGGKLEALDKFTLVLSTPFICVATVVDILGNRVRIHLDGWTDHMDYWADISSTNLYPVNWCDTNGEKLFPPKGYKDGQKNKTFNWTEYLKETNSEPIPEDAFVRRPLRDFSNKMIIEVVDYVVPKLLRIAKVVDVRYNQIKIIYDGFEKIYGHWVEDGSPDIHPVGWSALTNHPIEMPPSRLWSCLIPGCKGNGNSSNRLKINHDNTNDCPYKIDTWQTAIFELRKVPDRLEIHNILTNTTLTSSKTKSNVDHDENKETEHNMHFKKIKENNNEKRINCLLGASNIEPKRDTNIENSILNENIPSINKNELSKNIGLSLVGFNLNSVAMDPLACYWNKYNSQLGIPIFNTTDVRKWSVHDVASYIQKVLEYKSNTNQDTSIPDQFINQAIDGEVFLMLNQDDLMNTLKVPYGCALKIHYAIIMLRQRTSNYY